MNENNREYQKKQTTPQKPHTRAGPPPLRPWGSHNPKEQKKMRLEEIFRYIPFLFRNFGKLEISSNPSLLGVSATDAVKAKYDNPIVRR